MLEGNFQFSSRGLWRAGPGTWRRIILMIVFVVYSETCRQSSKIIDGPRGVVPPLSLVTMWRQEASVTTSSSHNDMRRHMDIHHPPDSSQLGGDNWITRSHRCHNLKVKWFCVMLFAISKASFYQEFKKMFVSYFGFSTLLWGAPPLSVETEGPLVSGGDCGFLDYTFAMKHNMLSAHSYINPFRLHPTSYLIPLLPLSCPFQHCVKLLCEEHFCSRQINDPYKITWLSFLFLRTDVLFAFLSSG